MQRILDGASRPKGEENALAFSESISSPFFFKMWYNQPMTRFVLMIFLCLLGSPAAAQPVAGWHEHSIKIDGMERLYRIYVPKQYTTPPPAVLLLHGGTQSMHDIFKNTAGATQEWLPIAEEEGVVIVAPNGTGKRGGKGDKQTWNDYRLPGSKGKSDADDVTFLNKVLDAAITQYGIDRSRIYVTGSSNGGMMTYRLLIETPERFAAAAAFISSLPSDNAEIQKPKRPTPLLIMNGTEDPLVKWEGGPIHWRHGNMLPVAQNVKWWINANHSDEENAKSEWLPDTATNDDCRIQKITYPAKKGGVETIFYRMDGGGHTPASVKYRIPNNFITRRLIGPDCADTESNRIAWDFFKRYTLPQ